MEEVETRHGNWRTRSSSDRSLFRTFAKHGWTPSSLWCLDSHAFLPAIMALLQMMGRAPAATARMFHFAKWWSWATYIHSRSRQTTPLRCAQSIKNEHWNHGYDKF